MQDAFEHYRKLRGELSRWLEESLLRDGPDRNQGGEDEANYALTFFQHYLVTGEERIVERCQSLLRDLETWVEMECVHGYEPEAEAHHGTEPFLLFLPRYLGLFPRDEVAGVLLEDAAEHIGNWVGGIPDWYDWRRDVFRSYRIGTRLVDEDPRFAYELAEHLRFVHIALAAHRVSEEPRYGEWALRYGRKRAERLLKAGEGPLPVLWDLEGRPLYSGDLQTREQQRMGASSMHVPGDPLAGTENLLASGAVYAFGDLYRLSGDALFQEAARRIVEDLPGELLDPFADPAAAALSYYRYTFQDPSLDEEMLAVLERLPPESEAPWAMVFPQEYRRRERGVGKRMDMVYWGEWSEDGSVRPLGEPCTAALALVYQLTGEVDYARRALRGAATKFHMARRVLRGGREHTDMGGATCSVAAGHGRNWGCGAVTGCYGPLLLGTREGAGKVDTLLECEAGHLPAEVLSLVRPPVEGPGEVRFYNGGAEEVVLSWRQRGEPSWRLLCLQPGEAEAVLLSGEDAL